MTRRQHLPVPAALIAAVLLAGCGITDPYSARTTSSTRTSATATNPVPVNERNGQIPAKAAAANDQLSGGASSASLAIETFTRLYVNWTATTVAANQRHLAAISLDGARAAALQAARSYGADSTLQSSRVSNSGQIISLTRGRNSANGEWVVVTREQTRGSASYTGLPAGDHVYLAQTTHTTHGWAISSWTPQS